jgi:hypothetical protein
MAVSSQLGREQRARRTRTARRRRREKRATEIGETQQYNTSGFTRRSSGIVRSQLLVTHGQVKAQAKTEKRSKKQLVDDMRRVLGNAESAMQAKKQATTPMGGPLSNSEVRSREEMGRSTGGR